MITREAKISLLVTLAFLLVVGILLSEHLTTSREPTPAPLADAARHARPALEAPNASPRAAEPQIPSQTPPRDNLNTRDALDQPAPLQPAPDALDQILEPANNPTPNNPTTPTQTPETETPENATPGKPTTESPRQIADQQSAKPDATLQDIANLFGEEIVPAETPSTNPPNNSQLASNPTNNAPTTDPAKRPTPDAARVRSYVAQKGDTLSKIARTQLGANTPANRQAIVALNPTLQADPNKIIEGHTYIVPADAWNAALLPNQPPIPNETQAQAQQPASTPDSTQPAPTPPTRLYTVQKGDSLWRIAERELGNPALASDIRQLNADLLGDSDTVKVGMQLKLPAQAVSSSD